MRLTQLRPFEARRDWAYGVPLEDCLPSTLISMDSATLARLDATAWVNSASRDEALKEAIDNYCEYDAWFRAKSHADLVSHTLFRRRQRNRRRCALLAPQPVPE